jgi:chromosome partitioning protein
VAQVIAIANQKGGAGKSTMAANLSAAWGQAGHRVLALDTDPQFNLSEMFGVHPDDAPATLAEVFTDDGVELTDARVRDVAPNVDLICSSTKMAAVESTLTTANFREEYLSRALGDDAKVDADYELVVIDCPPNLGDLTVNALFAANDVVVPIDMTDRNAWKGAHDLLATISMIQRKRPELSVAALVRNAVDRNRLLYRSLADHLKDLGVPVAKTEIPQRAAFQNSGAEGVPLVVASPESDGAAAYKTLAKELGRTSGRATKAKAA